MAEDLQHVIRRVPPWRHEDLLTECGLDSAKYPSLTPEQFDETVKRLGQQRASMQFCMTCWGKVDRYTLRSAAYDGLGSLSLADLVSRDVYGKGREQLDRELHALALLAEAHPQEFTETLKGLAEATDLGERRTSRRARGQWGHV